MPDKQKTIKKPVSVKGIGLHTGKDVTLTFKPSDQNTGIHFLRKDINDNAFIKVDISNVADTSRGTTLEEKGNRISTVEHVLAAIAGYEIDNIIIEVDSPETPILDGSAKQYIEALHDAGKVEQDAKREIIEITETIRYKNEENGCEIIAVPCDHYRISCMIDFNTKILGNQHASLDNISDFCKEIAPSRTFVFFDELEKLFKNNLIKGGDLDNAIIFVNKKVTQSELDQMASLFNRPSVKVKKEGILNNLELYYHNEPARHKLLDLIGDLSLIGKPIKAHIIANKPGHYSNIKFVKKMKEHIKNKEATNHIPKYDPDAKLVYDINDIKKILPHRNPFLLVDKVLEMSDSHVVGLKNVTMNEDYFIGHFPNEPIMPGVLQIEAMAQTGGILCLSTVEDPENYSTYFLKIDKVKFKRKVVPGDTLIFKLSLLSPIRRGICHMSGVAYVGNNVALEAELMARIVKKETEKESTQLK